jgi:type II secretory pathway pseudopilin PulG
MAREGGFSLLELTMVMAIMMTVVGSVFSLLNPAQGSFAMEPEVADLQQRLRVAQDTLYKDLIMAGAGAYLGEQTGSLLYFFPPVLPFRQGAIGEARVDTITLIYVPSTTAQTRLAEAVTSGAGGTVLLNVDNQTGFRAGMTVLLFDNTGNYDTFTINSLNNSTANITVNRSSSSTDAFDTVYPVGSKVVQAVVRTYYLKRDTYQLVYYDGSTGLDVPVVDNMVDLLFEYWGDPNPPKRTTNAMHSAGPWMTYGPAPVGAENCLIAVDQGAQIERLPTLPVGSNANVLVKLTSDQLTDGSLGWCPTDTHPSRYSPNLFRIRKIVATIRLQAGLATMRGPASALFRVGGTSTSASRWIPDQQVRFEVSPRNMNLGR